MNGVGSDQPQLQGPPSQLVARVARSSTAWTGLITFTTSCGTQVPMLEKWEYHGKMVERTMIFKKMTESKKGFKLETRSVLIFLIRKKCLTIRNRYFTEIHH